MRRSGAKVAAGGGGKSLSGAPRKRHVVGLVETINGGLIGGPRDANKDCTKVAAALVLPVGYVVSASRIADRRIILTGYRLADLLTWVRARPLRSGPPSPRL
jgi:hypothetical protein